MSQYISQFFYLHLSSKNNCLYLVYLFTSHIFNTWLLKTYRLDPCPLRTYSPYHFHFHLQSNYTSSMWQGEMSSSFLRCKKNYKLSGYEILDLQEIHISFICFNQFHSDSQSPSCQARGKFTKTLLAMCDPQKKKQRQELTFSLSWLSCHPHWASPLWPLEIWWPSTSIRLLVPRVSPHRLVMWHPL